MTRKRPTPNDVALVVDPMSKPDPLYALTCNLNRVGYGYPGHTEPRYYGQEGWPPPKALEPMEEAPAWVPWSERHPVLVPVDVEPVPAFADDTDGHRA